MPTTRRPARPLEPRARRRGIDLTVADARWRALGPGRALVRRAAGLALREGPPGGRIAVRFTSDAEIADLNQRFRGRRGATNVLSFPAVLAADGQLGDVALAFETVEAEAEAQGKPFSAHTAHLVVHGILHILGYDHERDDEAEAMEAKEREILARVGIADPYGDTRTGRRL